MTSSTKRVAVVTGSAQGIGFAIAKRLYDDGMRVVIADLRGASDAVARLGQDADSFDVDVSIAKQVRELMASTVERFGRLDVVVNNAGLFTTLKRQPFDEISLEDWRRVFAVNVEGVLHCCSAAAVYMKQARSGSIINIASATAAKGTPNMLHYVASKGAVVTMTRSIARELGEFNVRVNTVSPGLTMSDGLVAADRISDSQLEAARQSRALHRDIAPDDIAGAVSYFASESSTMITGQTLMVDGGMLMN